MGEEVGEAEASLQEQVESQETSIRKYGTFAGVFTPTTLTILGVIMFLRLGWVVGNAGLLGAWSIILLAVGITTLTALSMSSITTNIRIGAGGAYSIISQALGLEVGGSIGLPLYLAQGLAATMYIFGFREGWRWIFPSHSPLLVDLLTFGVLFLIANLSTSLAFRVQHFILAIIAGSLISVGVAAFTNPLAQDPTLWGEFVGGAETGFTGISYWGVFAVFFPAVTGIMAGANMSGELSNPRESIPVGTLSAIGVSFVVYMGLAYWLSRAATVQELVNNYTIMIDKAAWGPIVLGGLLGATFSSALASLVGAPRILFALGQHGILPGGDWLSERGKSGEPRNAMMVTGVIALAALMLRDLNTVAPLLTMFFLITYFMLNLVVVIEQSLSLVSFRPLFSVHWSVPLLGAVGCLFAMVIVNPTFALIAGGVVLAFHAVLVRRQLHAPYGDLRSGMFVALAEWAAAQVITKMPDAQERTWKPDLLIPIEDVRNLSGIFRFVSALTYPRGTVKLMGMSHTLAGEEATADDIQRFARAYREKGIFASSTILNARDFGRGVVLGIQAYSGTFLRPNVVFLTPPDETDEEAYRNIIATARSAKMGVVLFARHPLAGLARESRINVWIHDRASDWDLRMDIGNLDLAILTAYKVKKNWEAGLRLITVVRDSEQCEPAQVFLEKLREAARIPDAEIEVAAGDFEEYLEEAPPADLNIFGLQQDPDFGFVQRMLDRTDASCVFVRDSGEENALA